MNHTSDAAKTRIDSDLWRRRIRFLVVNCRKDNYHVFCGRPSVYGNPWSHLEKSSGVFRVDTKEQAINAYGDHLMNDYNLDLINIIELELPDKILGCYCAPSNCHADFIAEIANPPMMLGDFQHTKASQWIAKKAREKTAAVHPCDYWLFDRCGCRGACSCHWVE